MKKLLSIFFICTLFFSCSNDSAALKDESESSKITEAKAKANDKNVFTEFKVTIYNLGGIEVYTNILSPGTFVVQKKNSAPLFMIGVEDYGEGLEGIAEDGDPAMLTMSLKMIQKSDLWEVLPYLLGQTLPDHFFQEVLMNSLLLQNIMTT